ncbi:MAG: hypothetical protein WCO96_09355 [Actinomycetes bacterium]
MNALAVLIATAAIAPPGVYAGSSSAAPSVVMKVRSGTVVEATAWTSTFNCELGGLVGPAQVTVRPRARVSKSGRISINSGTKTRRLRAKMRFRGGRITGKIRIVGNIAGPCSSPAVPVTLSRR